MLIFHSGLNVVSESFTLLRVNLKKEADYLKMYKKNKKKYHIDKSASRAQNITFNKSKGLFQSNIGG